MNDRDILLRAIADRAYALANDGESAPDYRWMNQYINAAAVRYKAVLTSEERQQVARMVKNGGGA